MARANASPRRERQSRCVKPVRIVFVQPIRKPHQRHDRSAPAARRRPRPGARSRGPSSAPSSPRPCSSPRSRRKAARRRPSPRGARSPKRRRTRASIASWRRRRERRELRLRELRRRGRVHQRDVPRFRPRRCNIDDGLVPWRALREARRARGEGALPARWPSCPSSVQRCASGVRRSAPAGAEATEGYVARGATADDDGRRDEPRAADDDASAQAEGCDHHAYARRAATSAGTC